MGINEFCETITKDVSLIFKEEAKVQLEYVEKNNGVCLKGLFISNSNSCVQPAIYLDGYYEDFKNGRNIKDIVDEIIRIYKNMDKKEDVDMEFFREYRNVKERICFKLVHYERNKELLSKVPFLSYLDLAIVFYYAFSDEKLGSGSILIRDSHMKYWGIKLEELYHDAAVNTERVQHIELVSLEELIYKMCEDSLYAPENSVPMYVLTNKQKQFGAAMMLYTKELKKLADRVNKNLYILPSSIHEGAIRFAA